MDKEERKRKMAQAWCDFQERMMMSNSGCGPMVLAAVLLVVVVLTFFGCTTTKYVPIIEHQTDTLIQTKVQHDSIYINDSTVITENGDTVKIEKWHTKYVEKQVHDTLYIAKNDTVPQPYPVIKEVPAELTWWQQFRLHLANILIYVLLGIGGYYLLKYTLKRFMP